MRIKFHPIHYTALVTVLLILSSLWLAWSLNSAMIFAFGCVMIPLVSQVGRFEEMAQDEDDPGYSESRAGFMADLKGGLSD
jgi:hypothetical protein